MRAQALADASTLQRLGKYAETRRKFADHHVEESDKAWKKLMRRPPEIRAALQPIVEERLGVATAEWVLLTQLISLGKGQEPWRAGPFVPLSRESVSSMAAGLNQRDIWLARRLAETAGRLSFARTLESGSSDAATRDALLKEQRLVAEVAAHQRETLEHVLRELGLPSIEVLYEQRRVATALGEARMQGILAERARRAEIGASLWVGLGMLALAGKMINAQIIADSIASFKQRCITQGGKVYDGYDPKDGKTRLIECR
jgi:hypothetical protein